MRHRRGYGLSADFLMLAIQGVLDGRSAERLADEYMERMGWNAPVPPERRQQGEDPAQE